MRYFLPVLCSICSAQTSDVIVSRDSILIEAVHRGSMPLRLGARGSVTETNPATITAAVPVEQASLIRAGQPVAARVAGTEVEGKVVVVSGATVKVELAGPVPSGMVVGTPALVRIRYSQIQDTLFVARPASARENTDAGLFRIDLAKDPRPVFASVTVVLQLI